MVLFWCGVKCSGGFVWCVKDRPRERQAKKRPFFFSSLLASFLSPEPGIHARGALRGALGVGGGEEKGGEDLMVVVVGGGVCMYVWISGC